MAKGKDSTRKDYIESDPLKTNTFVVGDLVRIFVGEVDPNEKKGKKLTFQGLVEEVEGDFITVGGELYLFYQARKLTLPEPQETWFKPVSKTILGQDAYVRTNEDPKDPTWTKYIEVR